MARINIEECWWSDPRRTKLLLKIGFAADSAAVNMWRTAQEFWGKGREPVPKEVFDKLEHADALIECGLAVVRERSVYVRGSSEYLEWTAEKREQAREAGKKSAESRRKKNGSAQPTGGKGSKKSEREPNDIRTEVNGTEPSDSGSGSGSVSDSGLKVSFPNGNDSAGKPPERNPAGQTTNRLIAKYCEAWRDKHGQGTKSPDITGKDAGILKRLAKNISPDRLEILLAAFFQMPDSWLMKTKHPLEQFELKLKEVAAFADSGAFVTRKQAQQFDNMATNMVLLEQVRRGEA